MLLPDHRFLMFGGETSEGVFLNDTYILKTNSLSWIKPTVSGTVPPPRSRHSVVVVPQSSGVDVDIRDIKVIVFGGRNAEGRLNDLYSMTMSDDCSSVVWTKIDAQGRAPPVRSGHSSTVIGNKMVIFGGWSSLNKKFNDVHVYDVTANSWDYPSISGAIPEERDGPTSLSLAADGT